MKKEAISYRGKIKNKQQGALWNRKEGARGGEKRRDSGEITSIPQQRQEKKG